MAPRPVLADLALAPAARTASASSGPIAAAGQATTVLLGVHCTAASGTTPTLDVALEESADGASWTAVTGSAAAQLTAAGNRVAFAAVTKNYVRVAATIGGTTPSFTFSAAVHVLPN
ncbi:hypothetical protein [Kitasatospora purpeofusca]|uniref:hypothetical protein n=1 Tax=Kitasatospora purpeofusca TaxID=67352 RepID=UPI0022564F72|nr:hypothetical protein [Kitasatospora purpeofusca]MCX4752897.1 hypothetical protein [Kitasatospora purpeofusca]WSR32441.1 hypothetical protein OG715_16495 [Kitasatospora purpeofusca]WSR40528.1 hypothetical protein OG196_16275 [Kitasatospora purpeofusca]